VVAVVGSLGLAFAAVLVVAWAVSGAEEPKKFALLVGVNRYRTRIFVDKRLKFVGRYVDEFAAIPKAQTFRSSATYRIGYDQGEDRGGAREYEGARSASTAVSWASNVATHERHFSTSRARSAAGRVVGEFAKGIVECWPTISKRLHHLLLSRRCLPDFKEHGLETERILQLNFGPDDIQWTGNNLGPGQPDFLFHLRYD